MTLRTPDSSKLYIKAFTLSWLISFATSKPSEFNLTPNLVLFPPGAAHKSSTLSPGLTSSICAGYIALGSCM